MRRLRGIRLVAISSLLVGGLAIVAVLIARIVGATLEDELHVGGRLGIDSRGQLSLCVDGAAGAARSEANVMMVQQALEATFADAIQLPTEYENPSVTAGCPAPVGLTGHVLWRPDSRFAPDEIPVRLLTDSPDEVSPHILHVYFVPTDVYARSFGGDAYATVAEEMICEGDVCPIVTSGIYVRSSATVDVLQRALRSALTLLPELPDTAEYQQFCLTGTPEQWCYQFNYCEGVPTDPTCEAKPIETETLEAPQTR